MKRPGRTTFLSLLAPLLPGVLLACGNDSNFTQDATSTNTLTAASVFAITGSPAETAAAYQLSSNSFVRPVVGQLTGVVNFDVAFDIRADGKALLIPVRQLVPFPPSGVPAPSIALQKSNTTFELLTRAPTGGTYVSDSVAVASAGETYLVKLVSTQCFYGESLYAKIAIDSIIVSQRRLVVRSIANLNCGGYRGLTVGIPTN